MGKISSRAILLLTFLFLTLILIHFASAQPQINKIPPYKSFLTKNLERLIPCTSFSQNNRIYLYTEWTGLSGEHEIKVFWIRPDRKVQDTTRFKIKVPRKTLKYTSWAWLGFKNLTASSKRKLSGKWKAQLFLDNKFLAQYFFSVTMAGSAETPTHRETIKEYLLTHQTKFNGRIPTSQELDTVLKKHKVWNHNIKYSTSSKARSNPHQTDLKGTNLIVPLSGANLKGANLSGANLKGTNLKGANFNEANLEGVHLEEVDLSGAELKGAYLKGAFLSGANFTKANFTKANLNYTNFEGANLEEANLEEANLSGAFLRGAYLRGSNFNKASLWEADLSETSLHGANLKGAYLGEANLEKAILSGTNFEGTYLGEANLSGAFFEPKVLPNADAIAYAENLSLLKYFNNQEALIQLRKKFKEAGFYGQERKITYVIKHRETMRLFDVKWNQINIIAWFEGAFNYVFFDLTTQWGMAPRRALLILLGLIPIFGIPYFISLTRPGKNGIWQKWSDNRLRTDLGTKEPVRLCVGWLQALPVGLYFSLLSAFNIGWREINVGNWIQRLQMKEYTLGATGWVRTVSGIQALMSVYLLAMWVLTYFGRPFE